MTEFIRRFTDRVLHPEHRRTAHFNRSFNFSGYDIEATDPESKFDYQVTRLLQQNPRVLQTLNKHHESRNKAHTDQTTMLVIFIRDAGAALVLARYGTQTIAYSPTIPCSIIALNNALQRLPREQYQNPFNLFISQDQNAVSDRFDQLQAFTPTEQQARTTLEEQRTQGTIPDNQYQESLLELAMKQQLRREKMQFYYEGSMNPIDYIALSIRGRFTNDRTHRKQLTTGHK